MQTSGLLKEPHLHSIAELFKRTLSQLLWEAFRHAAINARKLFIHNYPPLSTAMYSFIQLSEDEQCRVKKTCPRFGVRNLHDYVAQIHVCNDVFCLCSFQSCTLVISDAEGPHVPRRAVATRTAIAMATTRTWTSTTPRARAVLSDVRVYADSLR